MLKPDPIHRLMRGALREHVFPGASLMVSRGGESIFSAVYGKSDLFSDEILTPTTYFDLASLTKPLATSLAVLSCIQNDQFNLKTPLAEALPVFNGTPKSRITIESLLAHESGFPAYNPFYFRFSKIPHHHRKAALQQLLVDIPLVFEPHTNAIYSDLGFMVLEWIVEKLSGQALEEVVEGMVFEPLGITDLFFNPLSKKSPQDLVFAATELCPWRNRLIKGRAHDDNAYVMGGTAGHAGLFGNARGVDQLLTELLKSWLKPEAVMYSEAVFDPRLVKKFLKRRPHSGRALGFDCPSKVNSSSGHYFSKKSVGHLGYTGTSFWLDPLSQIAITFLTNRVHPTRFNNRLKSFRPILHDAIMIQLLN